MRFALPNSSYVVSLLLLRFALPSISYVLSLLLLRFAMHSTSYGVSRVVSVVVYYVSDSAFISV